MTVIPWWTKTGPHLVPDTTGRTSGRGRTEFADGLGARIPGSSEKLARFSHKTWLLQTRVKPVQESRAKNFVREETTETRPKHPHIISKQSERSKHRACHWSRAEKTHSLLPLPTTWTHGERRTLPNLQPRISFCQEMPLHKCIICHLTRCLMVRPRLLWDATPIRSTLSSLF